MLKPLGNVYTKLMIEYHSDALESHAFLRKIPIDYLDHLMGKIKQGTNSEMFFANTMPSEVQFIVKGKAEEQDDDGNVINDY